MKELVVISGKGGTGKTSIVAALASLAQDKVIADCDVDAADLHLMLDPEIREEQQFTGWGVAVLRRDRCTECGRCREVCRFSAIDESFEIDPLSCEGCTVCAHFCPEQAIEMVVKVAGRWFISETRHGPLVHAQLGIAENNSGKLVAQVKEASLNLARERNCDLILVDGAPGMGCPVIASLSGARLALIVTEPTVSGIFDMERIIDLAGHFQIKSLVCINKYDLNVEMSRHIEEYCVDNGIDHVASIPYDIAFTKAMLLGKNILEYSQGAPSRMIRKMWEKISDEL